MKNNKANFFFKIFFKFFSFLQRYATWYFSRFNIFLLGSWAETGWRCDDSKIGLIIDFFGTFTQPCWLSSLPWVSIMDQAEMKIFVFHFFYGKNGKMIMNEKKFLIFFFPKDSCHFQSSTKQERHNSDKNPGIYENSNPVFDRVLT